MNKLEVVTLKNNNGMELKVTNYGATIIGLKVPDKYNNFIDVVVGLKEASNYVQEPYINEMLFLGSSIGPYAGRISKGKFEIDGISYTLKHTEGVHLHGGEGFDKKYWSVKEVLNDSVIFEYLRKNLEEGYPGNLDVTVTYKLTGSNCLNITYKAKTDKATPVNLTSHPYINLNGTGSVLHHELMINSKEHLEVDDKLIPSGKLIDSKNTIFDYTEKSKINKEGFVGFDDTFVLNDKKIKASLTSEESRINLNIFSNQPAMVIYTPKRFPSLAFKANNDEPLFPAICFEPQNFPDAPNNSHFPNSILRPNEEYINEIIYEFSVI